MTSSFSFSRSPSRESHAPRDEGSINETSAEIMRALRSTDERWQLRGLQHLRKITFHEANRLLLVHSDTGLVSALVEALENSSDECRELILRVFCDLSNHPETKRAMLLLNPFICRGLLREVRGADPINHLAALTVLSNLSEDPQNAVYLLGSTLGLISNLFELLSFEPGETRMVALRTLLSLTARTEAPRQAAMDVTDMVSAMLCCAVLCCAMLCCAVLCYAMMCCAVLCYAML
jgi:hypothetical protein